MENFISKRRRSEVAVATRSKNNKFPADCVDYSDTNLNNKKYVGFHKDRRVAIEYVYHSIFNSPPEINWHRMKLILVICHLLNINTRSHDVVRRTLQSINEINKVYDGSIARGAGAKALILHGTTQAEIVYKSLQQGLSSKESTCILNMYREKLDIPEAPLSRSAVQGFMQRSDCIKTRKRQPEKSGKDDRCSQWAKARQEQAEQFKEQLFLGFLQEDSAYILVSPFGPIHIEGIVFWDEHHREVTLGEASAYQHMIS